MRLVGGEFVVLAGDWEHKHPKGGTPLARGKSAEFSWTRQTDTVFPAFYETTRVGVGEQPEGDLRRLEHPR